jgi:Rrf2 family cysteine metabolism transcriptional repressor
MSREEAAMLRVSTRGEYGVRLMVDLARHYGGRARSLTEISQAEGLELKVQYLEQLVKCLREAHLIESTRGAHGGYRLSRQPEEITMGSVLRALEGPIAPMICATEGEMGVICDRLEGCSTKYLWARVRDAVTDTLDSISLRDLLAQADGMGTVYPGPRLVMVSPPRRSHRATHTRPSPTRATSRASSDER